MSNGNNQHWVYIAFDSSLLTKVGYTADLDKRLATHRTGNPRIEVAAALSVPSRESAAVIERLTHTILSYGRDQQEWFSYSVETCVDALEAAARAWNELMRTRYTLVAWHPDDKATFSPCVNENVLPFNTVHEAPSQDIIDRDLLERALAKLVQFAEENDPREFAATANGDDRKAVERTVQWVSDFIAGCEAKERGQD